VVYGVSRIALPSSDWAGSDRASSDRGNSLRAVSPQLCRSSTFVAGPENRLALPALERLLSGDQLSEAAELFNPLVLLGSTGTGKSHLARGITRHWRSRLGDSEVEYLTAIDFARQLRAAREEGQLDNFRDRLANLQLLVVEDLHRLPHRPFVQRELRDTLDVLIETGALLVVTTQQPPAAMADLEAGLRDRLSGGLTVRLQTPGIEARRELLQLKAAERGLQLDDQQLQLLANKTEGPAPQLFRALAEFNLTKSLPVEQSIDSLHPPLKLKQIIAVVARYYSLTQAALRSAARRKSLVYARSVAVHLARTLTDLSYAQIGESLGRRDHSTIMHASQTLEKRLLSDASTQQDIEELKRILTAI